MQQLSGIYLSGDEQCELTVLAGGVFLKRSGLTPTKLEAETPDVLFIPGSYFERLIIRFDEQGRASSLIDRSFADDRVWKRVTD